MASLLPTPLGVIADIYSAVKEIKAMYEQVKANKVQSKLLHERVQAMVPPLEALERDQKTKKKRTDPAGKAADVASDVALSSKLTVMLTVITSGLKLVRKYAGSNCFERFVWSRESMANAFAEVNASLTQAQADLGFGLQVQSLFSQQREADDASKDMQWIKDNEQAIIDAIEAAEVAAERRHAEDLQAQRKLLAAAEKGGAANQVAVKELAQLRAELAIKEEKQRRYELDRYASAQNRKQQEAEFRKRVLQELKQAQQHAQSFRQPLPPVAALAVASSSPASPLSPTSRELMHIPLSELVLDAAPVGKGSFGEVYRAHWKAQHMTVAVKKLLVAQMTVADIADFDREVAVLHSLPYHPHVLQIHGVSIDQQRGVYWMVVNWMERGSLASVLTKHTQMDADAGVETLNESSLPLDQRLELCLQCAMAVNYLHTLPQPKGPILHRDLKSMNFLVDKHGEIKLCDFGLAKVRTAAERQSSLLQVAGTLCWMAPELFSEDDEEAKASTAADVYALGVVMWEIVTGRKPYSNLRAHEVQRAIKKGTTLEISPNLQLPAELVALLQRCWSKQPKQRPTCSAMIESLQRIMAATDASVPLPSPMPPPPSRPPPPPPREPMPHPASVAPPLVFSKTVSVPMLSSSEDPLRLWQLKKEHERTERHAQRGKGEKAAAAAAAAEARAADVRAADASVSSPVQTAQVVPAVSVSTSSPLPTDYGSTLRAGDSLDCLDTAQKWCQAEVIQVDSTRVLVHYIGFSDNWDEWIARMDRRLQPPRTKTKGDTGLANKRPPEPAFPSPPLPPRELRAPPLIFPETLPVSMLQAQRRKAEKAAVAAKARAAEAAARFTHASSTSAPPTASAAPSLARDLTQKAPVASASSSSSYASTSSYPLPKSPSTSPSTSKYDHLIKLFLIGDSGVGKSCLLARFANHSYCNDGFATIGIDFGVRHVEHDGKTIRLQIWDPSGSERFQTITSSYYREAHGFIIVYDVTDLQSFHSVEQWLNKIDRYARDGISLLLIGAKCDLDQRRVIGYEEGKALADKLQMPFFEISAKAATNVDEAVVTMVTNIMKTIVPEFQKQEEAMKQIQIGSVVWKSDQSASSCPICATDFTFTTRRHHCRNCGGLCCNACSLKRMVITSATELRFQRVCDRCVAAINAKHGLSAQPREIES